MEQGIKNVTGFIHKDQRWSTLSQVSGVLNNLQIEIAFVWMDVTFSLSTRLTFSLLFYCASAVPFMILQTIIYL